MTRRPKCQRSDCQVILQRFFFEGRNEFETCHIRFTIAKFERQFCKFLKVEPHAFLFHIFWRFDKAN